MLKESVWLVLAHEKRNLCGLSNFGQNSSLLKGLEKASFEPSEDDLEFVICHGQDMTPVV